MRKISRRTQSGEDKRGSSADRRARKTWLLGAFGNGTTAPCIHCAVTLTRETLQADRIVPGGTYRRSNIMPACGPCNRQRGDDMTWRSPLVLAAAAVDDAMALVSA